MYLWQKSPKTMVASTPAFKNYGYCSAVGPLWKILEWYASSKYSYSASYRVSCQNGSDKHCMWNSSGGVKMITIYICPLIHLFYEKPISIQIFSRKLKINIYSVLSKEWTLWLFFSPILDHIPYIFRSFWQSLCNYSHLALNNLLFSYFVESLKKCW